MKGKCMCLSTNILKFCKEKMLEKEFQKGISKFIKRFKNSSGS